jgi:hypothetical protein
MGVGNATISYSVTANPNTDGRTGTITVGDQVETVIQSGAPTIGSVSVDGKNLVVLGVNFDQGATIFVDGNAQKTLSGGADTLIGKKSAKRIASGQTVSVQVRDGDGAVSQAVNFMKP